MTSNALTTISIPAMSILTPTYCRFRFLKLLSIMIARQTFDLKKVEWIIVDDTPNGSPHSIPCDYFQFHPLQKKLRHILYHHCPYRMTVGQKRNLCKSLANGEMLVHMDDDDFYGPDYLTYLHGEHLLNRHKYEMFGSCSILLIYPQTERLLVNITTKEMTNMTCGGIMSYSKKYADTHHFNGTKKCTEEIDFLANHRTPVLSLAQMHHNMVIVHSDNTCNKSGIPRKRTEVSWIQLIPAQLPEIMFAYLRLYPLHGPMIIADHARYEHCHRFIGRTSLSFIIDAFSFVASMTLILIGDIGKIHFK